MNKFVEFHLDDGSLYAPSINAITSFEPLKATNGTILHIGHDNFCVCIKESYDEVKKALTGDIDIPKKISHFTAEEIELAIIDEKKRNGCDVTHCVTCEWGSSHVSCKYVMLANYINRKLKGINENDNN